MTTSIPKPENALRMRIGVIDFLRLISILLVLGIHVDQAGDALRPELPQTLDAWHLFTRNGFYGVAIFFVLSGYLITRWIDLREPRFFQLDVKRFYVRRAARILPLYVLIILFGFGVQKILDMETARAIFCFKSRDAHYDGMFWMSLVTMSFNWLRVFRERYIPVEWALHWGVLWSLAIEEQFYLLYPWFIKIMGNWKRFFFLLGCVVLQGTLVRCLSYELRSQGWIAIFTNSFGAFDLIALGCLFYFGGKQVLPFLDKKPLFKLLLLMTGTGLVFLVCSGGYFLPPSFFLAKILSDPARVIYAPTLLAVGTGLMIWGGEGIRFFQRPWVQCLFYPGVLSYGMYLWHSTVIYLLWPLMGAYSNPARMLVVTLGTILGALISYRFFEAPANALVVRLLSRKAQP